MMNNHKLKGAEYIWTILRLMCFMTNASTIHDGIDAEHEDAEVDNIDKRIGF